MHCHTTNPSALDALRAEIDGLDDQLLALAERRVALSRRIARAKHARTASALIRPKREEQVIDRLAARSTLPRSSLATLWHELMGLSLQAQRRTEVLVHAPQDAIGTTARTAARFGAAAPVIEAPSRDAALARARSGTVIAVVELVPGDPWWRVLAEDEELAIVDEIKGPGGRPSALCLARVPRDSLARARQWQVMNDSELAARLRYGETICPIDRSNDMALCIIEDVATLISGAA